MGSSPTTFRNPVNFSVRSRCFEFVKQMNEMERSCYYDYDINFQKLNKRKLQPTFSEFALKYGHGAGDGFPCSSIGFGSYKETGFSDIEINSDSDGFVEEEIPFPDPIPGQKSTTKSDVRAKSMTKSVAKTYDDKNNWKDKILKVDDDDRDPDDLYTQFKFGRMGEESKKKTEHHSKRLDDAAALKLVKKIWRQVYFRRGRFVDSGEGEVVDVGDEDQGIFGNQDEKASKRVWKKLDVMRTLLRVFIFIDYLFAWFEVGQYQLAAAENEFALLKGMYNCPMNRTFLTGFGDQVLELLRVFNAFLSFLVLFVSNEQSSTICACWMISRWILALLRAIRYFWLTRFLTHDGLRLFMTWRFALNCLFDLFGMGLVCFFYYEYSDLIRSRVNRLRSGRVLNLEIDAKHLDEFSQRKAAVRYAGNYQSTLLIKKLVSEAHARGNKWDVRDPNPGAFKFALEEGVMAYKYFRGIPVLKIEETGKKLRRRIRLRRLKDRYEAFNVPPNSNLTKTTSENLTNKPSAGHGLNELGEMKSWNTESTIEISPSHSKLPSHPTY